MNASTVESFKDHPTLTHVGDDLDSLVRLAVSVTGEPGRVTAADVVAAAGRVTPREYLDAVGVMLGFNFITRVASALGVGLDFWLRLPHLKAAPAVAAGEVA
jgi:hypothetical protein